LENTILRIHIKNFLTLTVVIEWISKRVATQLACSYCYECTSFHKPLSHYKELAKLMSSSVCRLPVSWISCTFIIRLKVHGVSSAISVMARSIIVAELLASTWKQVQIKFQSTQKVFYAQHLKFIKGPPSLKEDSRGNKLGGKEY
jgi:hypothetical protein